MNTETIKAIVSALVILIVNAANMFGFALDANALTQVILIIAALATIIWGIWKNHNFTEAAQKAQDILNEMKAGDDNADN